MRAGWRVAPAICLCIVLAASALAPAAATAGSAPVPVEISGALPGGGAFVLRSDPTVGDAAVELWFRAPGAGYDSRTPGISRLAADAAAASSAPGGTTLSKLVKRMGGVFSVNVFPDIVQVAASVPAGDARRVVAAMTAAYTAPSVDQDGLNAAVLDAAFSIGERRFDADLTLRDRLFAQLFAGGPAHYPATPGDVAALAHISLAQVRTFAERAFRPQNEILTLAGNVDSSLLTAVAAGRSGPPMDQPFDSQPATAVKPLLQTAPVPGIGFGWLGPPIGDAREATALDFVADYLFNQEDGIVAKTAGAQPSEIFVDGQFITLHAPGVLLVTVSGSHYGAVKTELIEAVAALRHPLPAAKFAAARNAFEYRILRNAQTPTSQADNFGWYTAEGDGPYAPGDQSHTYLREVESLDPQFVAKVVREYLEHPAVVELTVPANQEAAR
ncbi:MAG: peptidase M16 family protein [Vulcanimicrobiaceae bacterium]